MKLNIKPTPEPSTFQKLTTFENLFIWGSLTVIIAGWIGFIYYVFG